MNPVFFIFFKKEYFNSYFVGLKIFFLLKAVTF